MRQVRIAIADDHPLVIGGVQNVLTRYPHMHLISIYPNGAALMEGLAIAQPDVLLLDIQLPDQTGDELAPIIIKKYPDVRILTLTNFDSSLYAQNMFRHGVLGYILKNAEERLLISAIETVYEGREFLDPAMKDKMEHAALRIQKRSSSKSTLTLREKEILQLLVNGGTCPQIADQLHLSVNTVVNYRASIMLKLDVSNTAALVKKALLTGMAQ